MIKLISARGRQSRRRFLRSVAGLALGTLWSGCAKGQTPSYVDNPYAEVDWNTAVPLHSMSHQHQGQSTDSLDMFYAMGYRHMAFSNYYPSAPTPLPTEWQSAHPDALECPNAEHHSFLDSFTHCNGLGSLASTGAGWTSGTDRNRSPIDHIFKGTRPFDPDRPWESIYRLDVRLSERNGGQPTATLTVEGGQACDRLGNLTEGSAIVKRTWDGSRGSITIRATDESVRVILAFDQATTSVTQFRLMQGSNRPWRDVFQLCLDGEVVGGERVGGLQFPDGGGITINHPSSTQVEHFLEMLDFDERVLGIEVFNHLTSGFGSHRGFYAEEEGPHLHFYQLWDQILATGRRCLAFFVKDHQSCATGRNVLLVPPAAGRSFEQRQRDALVAYRRGAFYGCLGALATDDNEATVQPFDHTDFRFTRIELVEDTAGRPDRLDVAVAGNDPTRRPNVQIRFVTEAGVVAISDNPTGTASYPIPKDGQGRPLPAFVRVEAFAYPTEVQSERYDPIRFAKLTVWDIWQLHERTVDRSVYSRGGGAAGNWPVGVADLLFAQPIRFNLQH
jgi:hypothetical protein